jgi:hypothetical protein
VNPEVGGKANKIVAGIASTGGRLLRVAGVALVLYVLGMAIFAISRYSATKSTLLSYGISDATGSLIAWAVGLIAIGIPGLAIVRLFFFRGRLYNYVAAMILPLISWGMAQIPANFDASTGKALKFCSGRPDGTLFCLDHPGIDPMTQSQLVPMNSRLADLEFRKERGLAPKQMTGPVADITFFDSLTGQPRVWVHKSDDGCFDMFDNPGADPQSGEALSPVTKEFVRQIKECVHRRQQTTITANGARGSLFSGVWVNENNHSDGVTRLRVSVRLNLMSFEAWGKCHPNDCSMGNIATMPTSDGDTGQVHFSWKNPFSVREFQIKLVGPARLELQTTTTFTDDSGRPKYSMLEYMLRE